MNEKKDNKKKQAPTTHPRCGGRWTQARFNSFVRSALRGAFRRWQPKYDVLADAFTRVRKNKTSGRQAKHYRCAICKEEYPHKQMSVDHVEAIGPLTTWDEFIERLFCEKTNLQAACRICHAAKTKKERSENAQR